MKNTVSEMKTSMDRENSELEATKEKASELEHFTINLSKLKHRKVSRGPVTWGAVLRTAQ